MAYPGTGSPALPWPPEWRHPPLGGWRLSVLCAIMVLLIVPGVLLALVNGAYAQAAGFGAGAVVFGLAAWAARPRPAGSAVDLMELDLGGDAEAAVRFAVRPATLAAALAMLAGGAVLLAGAVTALVFAFTRGSPRLLLGTVVLGLPGALLLVGGVAALKASRRENAVDLTPHHVVVDLGHGRTVLAWDDIVAVDAAAAALPMATPRAVQNLVAVVTRQPSDHPARVLIPCGRLANDPVLVLHALRYYLAHPADRAELAGAPAVERLGAGRLT